MTGGRDALPPAGLRLDGKVAWVTGASRGLGRAIALGMARAGADVALFSRDVAQLDALAAEVEHQGVDALVVPGSVQAVADVDAAAARIGEAWGRIDVLVNSAGISPVMGPIDEVEDAVWASILDTNLTGSLRCALAARRLMPGRGSIINLSSIHATTGGSWLLPYSVSKAGIEAMTRCLAVEWVGDGVRVNAIAPGYFETDMTAGLRQSDRWRDHLLSKIPMGRFGAPHEVVTAALYLASDASSYVTGSTLLVDGGWAAT